MGKKKRASRHQSDQREGKGRGGGREKGTLHYFAAILLEKGGAQACLPWKRNFLQGGERRGRAQPSTRFLQQGKKSRAPRAHGEKKKRGGGREEDWTAAGLAMVARTKFFRQGKKEGERRKELVLFIRTGGKKIGLTSLLLHGKGKRGRRRGGRTLNAKQEENEV